MKLIWKPVLLKISKLVLVVFISIGGAGLTLHYTQIYSDKLYKNPSTQQNIETVYVPVPSQEILGVNVDKSAGLPVRIKIDDINLDAVIEKVGLTSKGDMDVPKIPLQAGWYQSGPYPGNSGTAVIDGHVNKEKNTAGVFADLHKLKPGAKIIIYDDKGRDVTFIVQETKIYHQQADASNVFFSSDEKSHLNLITCQWDKKQKGYTDRFIVFSEKEIE
jgi:sortase (surface protein transpeptidase)